MGAGGLARKPPRQSFCPGEGGVLASRGLGYTSQPWGSPQTQRFPGPEGKSSPGVGAEHLLFGELQNSPSVLHKSINSLNFQYPQATLTNLFIQWQISKTPG